MQLGKSEETQKQIVINKTEAPNWLSFRWGGTGDESKVYFDDADDLINKLETIKLGIEKLKSFTEK